MLVQMRALQSRQPERKRDGDGALREKTERTIASQGLHHLCSPIMEGEFHVSPRSLDHTRVKRKEGTSKSRFFYTRGQ